MFGRLRGKTITIIGGFILLGFLIFLSESRILLSIQSGTIRMVRAISQTRVGLFFFPGPLQDFPNESNDELQKRIQALESETAALRYENESLRNVFSLSSGLERQLKGARVFFYLNEGGKESLLIDGGEANGIQKGAFVFDSSFMLVGTVVETSFTFAKVDIATNPGNTFEGKILPTNTAIVAKGLGGGIYSLELVPIDTPIRKGDAILFTPTHESILARSLFFLGDVIAEEKTESTVFKTANAVSPVRPSTIREVFVLP